MKIRRLVAAIGVIGLTLALTTPALAQGNSGRGGGGKPPSCPDAAFPATLRFLATDDGLGPAIMASVGKVLSANVNFGGNVASRTETATETALDPNYFPLPVTLNFPAGSGYPGPDESAQIVPIDPHVSTWVFLENSTDLQALPCQMFDMVVNASGSYRMRLTLQWREKDGAPVAWDTRKWDQRWVLRYRPHKPEIVTWLEAVRTSHDTWVLTSRDDSELADGTLVPHFAHLQKDSTGNKKNHVPAVHTMPVMPIKLVITVDCNLGANESCAETGGGP